MVTAEQRGAVEHDGRRLVVAGPAGSGRTAVLVERYRRLVRVGVQPSRVLVLCPDRAAADRFRAAVLPDVQGGFESMPVTSVFGFAYDLVARAEGQPPTLVGGAEQRALVRRLLATEDPARWPQLAPFLHRPAFVREVIQGLRHGSAAGWEVAAAAGGRWAELARFADRYRAALAGAHHVDLETLVERAGDRVAAASDAFDHVLVDDAHNLSPPALRLLTTLARASDGPSLTITVDDSADVPLFAGEATVRVRLSGCFRALAPGSLVRSGHPSVEAEAVAGELLAAHRRGTPWAQMAVLVRGLGRRARSIGRALARHGVPVTPVPGLAVDEPVVRAVVDALRWAAGDDRALDRLLVSPLARLGPLEVRAVRRDLEAGVDPDADPRLARLMALRVGLCDRVERGDTPADLAYEVWAAGLADVGATSLGAVDDRALDALVALVDGLAVYAERNPEAGLAATLEAVDEGALAPDHWRASASAGHDGVTLTTIAASAGREWHTVVIAGCVEGELPRTRLRTPLFDPAALGLPVRSDDEERRLFDLATSRATGRLVATAAPEPGVLLSRYVESWPEVAPTLPLAPGLAPPVRAPTLGPVPVSPAGSLTLSASQLDTYDDCPLRYSFQYVLRARDEPGVHANLGTLAHKVLAAFLDPESEHPPSRTFEGLMGVADETWRDDVGRYRPQVEEARRDLVAMLRAWWDVEGSQLPDVVAVERPFDIEVGPHRLVGTIDRIDRVDGGLRIVDYKTGKSEPRPGDVAEDLQLAVYHLAAARDPQLAAMGPAVQLQLHYLRSMRRFDQPVTDEHEARTEDRVLATAARILAEDFEPSVDANCRTCSFHRLCPLQDQGRQLHVAVAAQGAAP